MKGGPESDALMQVLTRPRAWGHDVPLPEVVAFLEEVTRLGAACLEGDAARAALTDLRAALGAVVRWGRGPRTDEALVELTLLVRALVARGSAGLLLAVAGELRALAEGGIEPDACRAAASAFDDAAAARIAGRALDDATMKRMESVRAHLR